MYTYCEKTKKFFMFVPTDMFMFIPCDMDFRPKFIKCIFVSSQ